MKHTGAVIETEVVDGGGIQRARPGGVYELLVRIGEVGGIGARIWKHAGERPIVAIVHITSSQSIVVAQVVIDFGRVKIVGQSGYRIRPKVVAAGDAVGRPVWLRIKRQ